MSNVPKAREILEAVLENADSIKPALLRINLEAALSHMTREYGPRAPNKSQPVTPLMVERVKEMKQDSPDMHQSDIGAALGINPGRVSEILAGHYD